MLAEDAKLFTPSLNHFEVVFDGEYCAEPLVNLGHLILEYSKDQDYQRVLVDLTAAEGQLTMMGRYYLVSQMKALWPKELRTAVLVRPDQTLKAAGFIWARLSNYAGFATGIFFDRSEALIWLNGPQYLASNE